MSDAPSPSGREVERLALVQAVAPLLVAEAIRRDRAYRHPVNVAARGIGGFFRAVAGGGLD